MALCQITYASKARFFEDDARRRAMQEAILVSSRRHNTMSDVTGSLLCGVGYFYQVLEGPLESVADTFERIRCDERNFQIRTLNLSLVSHRAFAQWSMAQVDLVVTTKSLTESLLARAHGGSEHAALSLYRLCSILSRDEELPGELPGGPAMRGGVPDRGGLHLPMG